MRASLTVSWNLTVSWKMSLASILTRSLRMVNGSLVIVYPSLMRASLTVSWKISLPDISYCTFWVKNLIAYGERAKYKGVEGKITKENIKPSRKRGGNNPKASVKY